MKEQQKLIKRRNLCKIEDKKLSVQQVNPTTTFIEVILKPIIPVPDVKLRDADSYDPVWPVDPKLWNAYLSWKRSRKTINEERTVVFSFRKKKFFKKLEENTWILGDLDILSKFHFIYKTTRSSIIFFI